MSTAQELVQKIQAGGVLTPIEAQEFLKSAGQEMEQLKASNPEKYLVLLNALNAGIEGLNKTFREDNQ